MKAINIALADDHKIVRDGLWEILKNIERIKTNVVIDVSNGKELLNALQRKKADVVILDIQMPELNGEETLCVLTKRFPRIKVIILSLYNEWSVAEKFIKLGAQAFVCKNFGRKELEDAITAVINNKTYFSPMVLEDRKIQAKRNPDKLTFEPEEKLVLRYLLNGRTAKQMAEEFRISEKTIELYKHNLFKKTKTKNANSLVAYTMKNRIIDF